MSKENLNVLTEKQQENKTEDKKAFGKFAMALVFTIGCFTVGKRLITDTNSVATNPLI